MLRFKTWKSAVALAAVAALLSACEERTTIEKTDTVVVPVPSKVEPGPPGPAGAPGPARAPGPQGEPGKPGGSSTTVVVPPAPEPAKEPEKKEPETK
jgi:hypothetical protein